MASDNYSFRGPHISILFRHLLTVALAVSLVPGIFGQQSGEQTPYTLCSTYVTGSGGIVAVASSASGVAVGEKGGRIRLLSGDTLEAVWSAEVGGEVVSNLLVAGNNLYAVVNSASSEPSSKLRVLSIETGLIRRTHELASDRSFFLAIAGDSVVSVPESSAPVIFSPGEGAKPALVGAWSEGDSFLFAERERILLASANGRVKIASLQTGVILSEKAGSYGKVAIALVTSDGRSVVGTESGEIRAEAIEANGRFWTFKTGGAIVYLKSFDGKILAASNDNFLYLLSEDSGRVIWRSRLPGRPSTGALLSTGPAAFAVLGEERLLLIDISSGKVSNTVALEADEEIQPGGIFEGVSDGLLLHTTRGIKTFAANGSCRKQN
ncbi:MAG TPA: hypothetical protein DEP46_00175 [Blastocatellia bacterium]|nr:hypothetical protein [Blastocatellia bacterium]